MSFTYYMNPDSPVTRDYIRFSIRDTVKDSGPLPGDANFSDHELDMMLDVEGSWQRAVAASLEAMAVAWAKHPSFTADGLQLSQSHVAHKYDMMAQKWRKMYGAAPGGRSHARTVTKVDGYSQDIPATEVDDVTY